VEWIHLARDRVKWRALASTAMNLPVAKGRERLSLLLASEGEQGQQWLSTLRVNKDNNGSAHFSVWALPLGEPSTCCTVTYAKRHIWHNSKYCLGSRLAGHETSHSKALPASPVLPTAVTQDVGRYIAQISGYHGGKYKDDCLHRPDDGGGKHL
jgi:hypothetical protein